MVISHFFFMPFYLVYHLFFMVNDLMVLPKTNLLTKTKKKKTKKPKKKKKHKFGYIYLATLHTKLGLFYFILFFFWENGPIPIFFFLFQSKEKNPNPHWQAVSHLPNKPHKRESLAREERWKTLHTRESRDIFSIVRVVIELRREKKNENLTLSWVFVYIQSHRGDVTNTYSF